jgi:hypothetical protein
MTDAPYRGDWRPKVDMDAITQRLDALGRPETLDLRKIRYTLGKANVRTQRVPKVMALCGYERLPNPGARDGTFYARAGGRGTRITMYRRMEE